MGNLSPASLSDGRPQIAVKAIIRGNIALCAHHELVRYKLGRKRIKATHLFSGFIVLQGVAAGVSGCLLDN